MQTPRVVMVVDLRELALIYELTEEAAEDATRHSSDRQTAQELHDDCRALLGQDEPPM